MKSILQFCTFCVLLFSIACTEDRSSQVVIPTPKASVFPQQGRIDSIEYHDKVLGAIVGSAIGDAMGAPTEMWSREEINREYGYVNGLTLVKREMSAEGPWAHQMDSGATTDDTRWKYFMGKYFTTYGNNLSVDNFSAFIIDYYQNEAAGLSEKEILNKPDILDEKMQRINWIKEWARVALAYKKGGAEYYQAQNRFYGGEMSCAGMLYSPMFGLIAESPERAYEMGYEHGMFDIGYARDLTGIVATITQLSFYSDSVKTILADALRVDPYGYMDSRLIGRLANVIAQESNQMIKLSYELTVSDTIDTQLPEFYTGSKLDWVRQDFIYQELEKNQRAIAFHAGEIWQILYTGLLFGEGDFDKTMRFIVNYGRDNDTVAAIAGMILGAQCGYSGLPAEMRETTLKVSKEVIGIDLEIVASDVVSQYFKSKAISSVSNIHSDSSSVQ